MKKQKAKEIRAIAYILPEVYEKHRTSKLGSDILKENKDAKDAKGNPIKAKRKYTTTIAKPVNHENKLKGIYERAVREHQDPDKALMAYQEAVHNLYAQQQMQKEESIKEV
jgi:hypothetical protein